MELCGVVWSGTRTVWLRTERPLLPNIEQWGLVLKESVFATTIVHTGGVDLEVEVDRTEASWETKDKGAPPAEAGC